MSTVNASFLGRISNQGGNLTNLNVSEMKSNNLDAGNVKATTSRVVNNGYQEGTIVGFVPSSFATSAAAAHYLNSTPGKGAPSQTGALSLPPASVVTFVTADSNGTNVAGAANVSVLHGAYGTSTGTALLTAVPIANLNATGGVYRFTANSATGLAGHPSSEFVTGTLVSTTDNYLYAYNNTTNTAGDLRVTVRYFTLSNDPAYLH